MPSISRLFTCGKWTWTSQENTSPRKNKIKCKTRDGCCSLQQFYSDGCCFIKKEIYFFVFSKESFFFGSHAWKKVHLPLHRKTRNISKTTTHIRDFKTTFSIYVPNIIFEILLYNIKNFYEFELDNKSKKNIFSDPFTSSRL